MGQPPPLQLAGGDLPLNHPADLDGGVTHHVEQAGVGRQHFVGEKFEHSHCLGVGDDRQRDGSPNAELARDLHPPELRELAEILDPGRASFFNHIARQRVTLEQGKAGSGLDEWLETAAVLHVPDFRGEKTQAFRAAQEGMADGEAAVGANQIEAGLQRFIHAVCFVGGDRHHLLELEMVGTGAGEAFGFSFRLAPLHFVPCPRQRVFEQGAVAFEDAIRRASPKELCDSMGVFEFRAKDDERRLRA